VPPILLSGHHGEVARWRQEQALERTRRDRPDLIAPAAEDRPERRPSEG
jgi:tRNA (guanine37-N1)-methyltransferase